VAREEIAAGQGLAGSKQCGDAVGGYLGIQAQPARKGLLAAPWPSLLDCDEQKDSIRAGKPRPAPNLTLRPK
jgi:hypothetical protein